MTSDSEKAFVQVSIEKGDRDDFSEPRRTLRNRYARVAFGAAIVRVCSMVRLGNTWKIMILMKSLYESFTTIFTKMI